MNKKKTTKKVEKKDVSKKVEKKDEKKQLFNDKIIAILYLVCSLLWIVSGSLNLVAEGKIFIFDFIVGALLLFLSVVYFIKIKKENNK